MNCNFSAHIKRMYMCSLNSCVSLTLIKNKLKNMLKNGAIKWTNELVFPKSDLNILLNFEDIESVRFRNLGTEFHYC